MRIRQLLLLALAAGTANVFAQQALVCPPGTSIGGKGCDSFHYHMQIYRPDTRKFFEATALNGFATQTACERARDEHVRRNLAVVDYFKRVKNEQQYEPDRFGPCHCDMTRDKTNPAYLTDVARLQQIRTIEDIRLRVREKLLDAGLTSDNELVRGLIAQPPTLPAIGGSKLVPLPPSTAVTPLTSPDDLRATMMVDNRPPASAALDLPLVDVGVPAAPPAVASAPAATGAQPVATTAATTPAANSPAPQPAPQPQPATAPPVQEATVAAPEADAAPASTAAEEFVTYETDRIQSVLKAAAAISDENVKSKIIEASLQRNQLLSNLRTLIEGSGERSRLAAAVRAAKTEEDHVALAQKLFGSTMSAHWAPKDAADVVLPPYPIDTEPERVLRDGTGRFDEQQKKRALYDLLAKSQPTDEQQLWLVTVLETFLR